MFFLHLFERKSRAGFRGAPTHASAQSPTLGLHSVVSVLNDDFLSVFWMVTFSTRHQVHSFCTGRPRKLLGRSRVRVWFALRCSLVSGCYSDSSKHKHVKHARLCPCSKQQKRAALIKTRLALWDQDALQTRKSLRRQSQQTPSLRGQLGGLANKPKCCV